MKIRLPALAALFCLWLVPLFIWSGPEAPKSNELKPEEIINNLDSYCRTVERIRGLKFKNPVGARLQSVEDFRKFVKNEIDKFFSGKGRYAQEAWSRLGLIPKDYNLRKGLEDLVVSQAGAYYNPESKSLYIVKTNMPATAIEAMLIHELAHALQDQHYDLERLLSQATNDDEENALKYLVEGEATYIMTIASLEQMGMNFNGPSPILDLTFGRYKNLSRKELTEMSESAAETFKESAPDLYQAIVAIKGTPDFLFWTLTAPYYHGVYSAHSLVSFDSQQRDWKAIDNLYLNPPASTEQMIHLKKMSAPRDEPEPIEPAVTGEDRTILAENTLGELGFWILFSNYTGSKARETSEGWDGDKYFLIRDNKTNQMYMHLDTKWDSDNDAYESFIAYKKVLGKLHPKAKITETSGDRTGIVYELPDNSRIILSIEKNGWSAREIPGNQK